MSDRAPRPVMFFGGHLDGQTKECSTPVGSSFFIDGQRGVYKMVEEGLAVEVTLKSAIADRDRAIEWNRRAR